MRNLVNFSLINSLAILLLSFSCGACSPAEKMVFSQNFENLSAPDEAFSQWFWRHGQGTLKISDNSFSGAKSLYYKAETDRYWCLSSKDFEIDTGKPCMVSANIKKVKGAAAIGVRLVATTADDEEVYAHVRDVACCFEEEKWTRVINSIDLPEDTKTLRIEFCVVGESEGWIDDIQIKKWQQPDNNSRKLPVLSNTKLEEKLSRGTVAIKSDNGIYVSWRLLKTDPADIAFDLYRMGSHGKAIKINSSPITKTTDFIDKHFFAEETYRYAAVSTGANPAEADWSLPLTHSKAEKGLMTIKLQGDYDFQKLGIGDLDGDGNLDYVIKQPDKNVDPYSKAGYWYQSEGTYKLEAYRHDGQFLWSYDLGWAIERGVWYSPYIVCDLNQDGRCEVIVKTGEDDPRNAEGKVVSGNEFLTVLDGATGKLLTQVPYEPVRGEMTGPHAYNRYDSRNQFAIAYLDGQTPCLIVERGTYEVVIAQAYWLNGDKLEKLWQWRSDQWPSNNWGQGAHSIRVGDVDGDSRDEVLLGCLMLDDDGLTLWTTGQGHPDHCYMGDLDPEREGLEIYMGIETRQKKDGYQMIDATTGERIWGWDEMTRHVHSSGLVSDIDPNLPGVECYSRDKSDGEPQAYWFDAKGNVLSRKDFASYGLRALYWDADSQRELLSDKINEDISIQTIDDNIEGKVIAMADLYGDWREEVITSIDGELRIYSTTTPAKNRWVTLLQDPIYRKDVRVQSNGYLQVPTLSYDMATEQAKQD